MGIDLIKAFPLELCFQLHQVAAGTASREFKGSLKDVLRMH